MPRLPSDQEVDDYIRQKAPLYGINPTIAVNISRAERASRSTGWIGDDGSSFGPFQLHVGGIASGGNSGTGLGDVFRSRTGLDPRDIAGTWKQQVDFSLDYASKYGWEPWHAIERLGYGVWHGITRSIGGNVWEGLRYFFPVVGYSGNPRDTYHTPGGVDLFAPRGTRVRSVADGRVTSVSSSGPGGNSIIITGLDGLKYYYAHLNRAPSVKAGDHVAAGQPIGEVGNTGNASRTEPQLHLGIGYDITTGEGASGGVGTGFDAQTFLSTLLRESGSGEDAEGIATQVAQSVYNLDVSGAVRQGIIGGLQHQQQSIQNWVQDRAASIVLTIVGVLLILFSLFSFAMQNGTVRTATKGALSFGGAYGKVAAAAL